MDIVVPISEDEYDPVSKITKKKEIWRLGVIIDDLWTVYKGENEDYIDMLIRDIKGNTIQATIMGTDIEFWKPLLAEGKTYFMRNFKVHDNDSGFKMTAHKFRLTFVGATKADEVEIPGIPLTNFIFKDFSEIQSGKYQPDLLVDAIGVVDTIKKIVTATSTKKGNVAFTLKDLMGNVLDCTLWDGVSVEFLNKYNQVAASGPVVLIIKHARVKEPHGVYPLQFTNVWNGTKMLFDPEIPEIKTFSNSLPKDVTYPSQNIAAFNSTQFYSQSSGSSQYNTDETFMKQARIISIAEMKKLKVDTFCVTVATTSHIRVSNQGWFFRGLFHGDDTAKFVFWDNPLDELLGMTAYALLQKQIQRGLGDPQDYPRILDDIMERKFAFRVEWQYGWGGHASVLHCRDSKELIAKIQEQLPGAESTCKEIVSMNDSDVASHDSPPVQPNVSASAENDVSAASSNKTPAKRTASKNISIEHTNLESQFSATRSGKQIKKEKILNLCTLYGEVPPEFIEKFHNEVPQSVELWDINFMQHYLTLNKDHVVPHLTDGWDELMNHYHIEQVKEIMFVYLGGRRFWISIGKRLNDKNEYPSFHSESTMPNETVYFDVVLSRDAAVSSQLNIQVNLANKFDSVHENSAQIPQPDTTEDLPTVLNATTNKRKLTALEVHDQSHVHSDESESSEDDPFDTESDSDTDNDDVAGYVSETNSTVPQGYSDIGDPLFECKACGAHMCANRVNSSSKMYNSMFSFTSPGMNFDKKVNGGRGPPILRLHGQPCHRIGSMLPNNGETPKFAELYIYDTDNKLANRIQSCGLHYNILGLPQHLNFGRFAHWNICEREYIREGKVTKMVIIELSDASGKCECALFGDYVDELNKKMGKEKEGLPVVVIQFPKVKISRDKTSIQNVINTTRIFVNPDIPEAKALKKGIDVHGIDVDNVVPVIGGHAKPSLEEEFLLMHPKKKIADLDELEEDGVFAVFGMVSGIVKGQEWWYPACKCHRSVVADSGAYYCSGCSKHVFQIVPRFKVKIEVSDGAATCVFVLFDSEMSYIMEKSCAQFVAQSKVSNDGSYPAEFESLVGKTMLFTIDKGIKQTTASNGTFRVKRTCIYPNIIEKFSAEGPYFTPVKPMSQAIDVDSDSSLDDVDVVGDSQPLSFMKDIIVTPPSPGNHAAVSV
ncbi:hypothetical protein TSUD_413880 [Trifolium subterraneum]|uniref:Uncharacterized protein n=1 Tax=Trifolium subterraneum TaxID=3900 RepID=A0A2Z6P523_TRISU|nr:hypothetical protein TSUD_413880 [Trifolium subterraneum]